MNKTHDIPAFFIELWKRFWSKTPKFFQVINFVSGACALITGLPAMIESAGVQLPPDILKLENKTVSIAALVGLFIGKLTTQRTVLTGGGGAVTGAPKSDLPYTTKKEEQAASK